MAMIERGGISSLYVGGASWEVSGEVTISVGGIIRTAVVSSNGVAGYTTHYKEGVIEFEALDGPAVAISALRAANNVPVQVMLNNGKSWFIKQASQVDDVSVKVHEGKVSGIKIAGDQVKEVLA